MRMSDEWKRVESRRGKKEGKKQGDSKRSFKRGLGSEGTTQDL